MGEFNWVQAKEYQEIIYETMDGIAKITINRPERRNAFTPLTAMELFDAFSEARDDSNVGVVILTGANHGGHHEDEAFCSGGDQKIRGTGGYVGADNIPRLELGGGAAFVYLVYTYLGGIPVEVFLKLAASLDIEPVTGLGHTVLLQAPGYI